MSRERLVTMTDLDVIRQIQDLVGARAAYPLIATVLTLVVQLARKTGKTAIWWTKIPNGWRWIVPGIAGAVMGFIHGWQGDLPLSGALISAGIEMLYGLFGVSVASMGLAALLKESPIPWDGGSGGKPRTVIETTGEPSA